MKVVYASRTGNVESIISKLGIEDALKVEDCITLAMERQTDPKV